MPTRPCWVLPNTHRRNFANPGLEEVSEKGIVCIEVCNNHPNKHVNQDERRIWGEKLGESLANGQPEWMKIVATIAPDKIKEVYLTKVEVKHGSLL